MRCCCLVGCRVALRGMWVFWGLRLLAFGFDCGLFECNVEYFDVLCCVFDCVWYLTFVCFIGLWWILSLLGWFATIYIWGWFLGGFLGAVLILILIRFVGFFILLT